MYKTVTGANKKRSYNGDYMDLGLLGEAVVMEWLRDRPEVLEIDDYRKLQQLQKADVDCGIYTQDGRVLLAEIKTCQHLGVTENILFEVLRINHTAHTDHAGVLGWSLRSPATWLLYYAYSVEKIYRLRFSDFRKAFQAYTKDRRKLTAINYTNTDEIKSTVNVLIPFEKYVKQYTKIYDLEVTDDKQRQAHTSPT